MIPFKAYLFYTLLGQDISWFAKLSSVWLALSQKRRQYSSKEHEDAIVMKYIIKKSFRTLKTDF